MATIIKIKRSVGSAAPGLGLLAEGELAYSQDRTGNGALAKLYIHSKDAGGVEQVHAIGGKYFTDIIDAATDLATANTLVKRDGTGSADFVNLDLSGNLSVGGDVTIAGSITVAQSATVQADFTADTATIIGNFQVNGNTVLGDNATIDSTTINGFTKIVSGTTKALGNNVDNVFKVEDSNGLSLFDIKSNGDVNIAGIINVNGDGTSTFAGNVAIGGSITVAENATVTADFSANDATITGNLLVHGNTVLGDNPATDTTTINGVATVVSAVTKAAGNDVDNVFKVTDSAGQSLFDIKSNGDVNIAGIINVNGDGTSTFAGNVAIGGSITVAENATVTADFSANDATITGNLIVNGNTTLGNDVTDVTSVYAGMSVGTEGMADGVISLQGSGRITGIDVVQDPTDAVNKAYVDAAAVAAAGNASVQIANESEVNATRYVSFTDQTTGPENTFGIDTALTYNPSQNALGVGVLNTTGDINAGADVIIAGNLVVNGTTTTVNSETLTVQDPLIKLASGNTTNSLDIGFYGEYNDGATKFAGIYKDAASGTFKLFTGLEVEPTTTVNEAGAGYAVGTLVANLTGGTVSGLAAPIVVADGGTGVSSFTSKGIVYGNGTNPLQVTAAGASGQVLQAGVDGTPVFGDIDGGTF